jgi:hypothetical protein
MVFSPGAQRRYVAVLEFREPRLPVSDDAVINEGLQERLKRFGARSKELRTVVELKVTRVAGCHAAACAPGFLKHENIMFPDQCPRDREPGKPCPNNRYLSHASLQKIQ